MPNLVLAAMSLRLRRLGLKRVNRSGEAREYSTALAKLRISEANCRA